MDVAALCDSGRGNPNGLTPAADTDVMAVVSLRKSRRVTDIDGILSGWRSRLLLALLPR
jgi:hypothetical protein